MEREREPGDGESPETNGLKVTHSEENVWEDWEGGGVKYPSRKTGREREM